MSSVRSKLRQLRRVRPRHAAPVLAALALALSAWPELPVLASGGAPRPWQDGRLMYYDASGSSEAVAAAARRWNRSGVRVHVMAAPDRESADVVFDADRRQLRRGCGPRCLGLSSSIGRPREGRVTVLLDPEITGRPTALNVWVAMHELGHVLRPRHREGSCSLMNAQAYDDACTFTGGGGAGPAAVRARHRRRGGRRAPLRTRRGGPALPLTQRTGYASTGTTIEPANLSCHVCFSPSHSIQK